MADLAQNAEDMGSATGGMVYVVDDDASLRKALAQRLMLEGYVVQAYASAEAFLAADISPSVPACILLDVKMDGMSGLALQRELRKRNVRLPIVFLTAHGDVPMSVDTMKAGAVNFLLKPARDEDLLRAVSDALTACNDVLRPEWGNLNERFAKLTKREREIFNWVVSGLPNKAIAAELGLAEITVKVHRGAVMRKLRAASLPDLVRMHAALSV